MMDFCFKILQYFDHGHMLGKWALFQIGWQVVPAPGRKFSSATCLPCRHPVDQADGKWPQRTNFQVKVSTEAGPSSGPQFANWTAAAGVTGVTSCSESEIWRFSALQLGNIFSFPKRVKINHTSYLSFFLHWQNFWVKKFTPKTPIFRIKFIKNATLLRKICRKCQFFALNL